MSLNAERRAGTLVLLTAALFIVMIVCALALWGPGFIGKGGAGALGPPEFVDETASAGIDHRYDGAGYYVGGGVAVFDCTGDTAPEVFVAGGSRPAALFRNDSKRAGALAFSRIAAPETDLTEVTGAYPIDVDGDGVIDLAVLRRGENVLLRGLGACRFERANETWAFDGGDAWSTAFSAKWEGAARLPTIAIGNYVVPDTTGRGIPTCADNELVRPGADRYQPPFALTPGWCTLSILFSDWDRSGRGDLRVSNDRHYYRNGEEQLWRIETGEAPRLYSANEGWAALHIWGMGIASHDLTGDGYPEVFLTSQGDNKLQTLVAGPTQPRYGDIALQRGAHAPRPFAGDVTLPSTAWHPEFQDVNNDGYVDLFISKGNVNVMPDFAQKDPSNLLLGQVDGTFGEAAEAAGIMNFDRGRGAALADFNVDGLLDLIEVHYEAPVRIWRNVGSGDAEGPAQMGGWLAVRPTQPGPNRDAIGGWIEVRFGETTLRRELTIGGGHVGGQLGWVHFGIGEADAAEIRVLWPDGVAGLWMPLEANRFAVIERDASEPRLWEPSPD